MPGPHTVLTFDRLRGSEVFVYPCVAEFFCSRPVETFGPILRVTVIIVVMVVAMFVSRVIVRALVVLFRIFVS
ncbi:MAG: hypothetical protein OQK99_03420 [Gammaproteobacteria bacterium]|nr:hypothetical protein [Gammaproteobacteria bacterium]